MTDHTDDTEQDVHVIVLALLNCLAASLLSVDLRLSVPAQHQRQCIFDALMHFPY
jgi:hypothetical protein